MSLLIVANERQTWHYALNTTIVQIGRGSQNDITLLDDAVSRTHARMTRNAGRFTPMGR